MANPYFAPMQNAMANVSGALAYRDQSNRQNMLDQQAMEQQQFKNSLASSDVDLRKTKMLQDLAKQQREVSGNIPVLAQRIMSLGDPNQQQMAYQVAAQRGLLGDQPPAFEELAAFSGLAEQPSQFEGLSADYETFLRANQMPNSPEAYNAYQQNVLNQKKAGATNVTVGGEKSGPQFGPIEKGYMMVQEGPDKWVQKPVPGSAASREEQEQKAKTRKSMAEANRKFSVVTNNIDKALGKVGVFTTGFIGKLLSEIPGSTAYDLGQTIDVVKANIGFDTLQKMREASPTGGALGQVSERELAQLERVLGSLQQAQSPQQLAENLIAVRTHYNNWKEAVSEASGNPEYWAQQPQSSGEIKFLGFE